MGHFSKKHLACQFAKENGFDYAHRHGLYNHRALYVADFRPWRKLACIGLPFFIVIEKGKARHLDDEETMNVLCGLS